jgi:hypothetical protein
MVLVVNHYDFDEWQTLQYINLHVFARRHDEANSTIGREIASAEKHRSSRQETGVNQLHTHLIQRD